MELWTLVIPGYMVVSTKSFKSRDKMVKYAYRKTKCVSHGGKMSAQVGDKVSFHTALNTVAYGILIYKEGI